MFPQVIIACVVFVLILLIIRTSYLNKRQAELEDYMTTCVTKDRLREMVVTAIRGAVESDDAK